MPWGSSAWGGDPWGGDLPPVVGSSVTSVHSRDLKHVRVAFVSGVDVSALVPSAYTLIAQSVPSYNPTVLSARFINGRGIVLNSLVELTLENDLSPGVAYQLTVADIVGLPLNQSNFVSYSPNWPARRQFLLWDVIPEINKAEDQSEHLERFVLCLQDQLDTTLAAIDNWTDILDSDRAPEEFLDAMLADLANPFAFEDLSENDKRLLLRVLVQLYQLKGTDGAILNAIRLFMGFEAQINFFRNSGSLLGTDLVPISLLDESFILGGGGPYDFSLTVATTEPAGRALTADEERRIERIVAAVKSVMSRFQKPVFVGLVAPDSVQIAGDTSDVDISWTDISQEPTSWRIYYRLSEPGVSSFNSASYVSVAGSANTVNIVTPIDTDAPGSTYYFVVVPYYGGKEGFRSEVEVRNNLPAPGGVATTPGIRSVSIAWDEVTAATSYRVYKRLAGACTPVTADFSFEVLGGVRTFIDAGVLPGQTVHYCVVARYGDVEGFYSLDVSGTAL